MQTSHLILSKRAGSDGHKKKQHCPGWLKQTGQWKCK